MITKDCYYMKSGDGYLLIRTEDNKSLTFSDKIMTDDEMRETEKYHGHAINIVDERERE